MIHCAKAGGKNEPWRKVLGAAATMVTLPLDMENRIMIFFEIVTAEDCQGLYHDNFSIAWGPPIFAHKLCNLLMVMIAAALFLF